MPEIVFSALHTEMLFRLLLSAFLGGLIGLERDFHGRAAGLRTHLLLCLGAALFTMVSEQIVSHHPTADNLLRADPGRIAAQVVTGVGFLGAGAIIKEGLTIRGLTTSACLWLAAAIGVAVGVGFYIIAIESAIIGLIALTLLNRVEHWYPKNSYRMLRIVAEGSTTVSDIITAVKSTPARIQHCEFERDYRENVISVLLSLKLVHRGVTDKMAHTIIGALEAANIPMRSAYWHDK